VIGLFFYNLRAASVSTWLINQTGVVIALIKQSNIFANESQGRKTEQKVYTISSTYWSSKPVSTVERKLKMTRGNKKCKDNFPSVQHPKKSARIMMKIMMMP
jgi:hypothetical protein